MLKKILIATEKPFSQEAVDGIRKIFASVPEYEVQLLEKYSEKSELIKAASDASAIIIRSDLIDEEVIEASNNLKIVVRAGAGYDNVDLKAATRKAIVVMNTPGQNSNAVAELAFGLMLNLARVGYTGKAGTELKDKAIGIHAYGNVGKHVGRIAKGFDMKIMAFDPFISKDQIEADGIKAVESAEELYSSCDYISLHIPANDKTKKSINYELMSKMPKNASLINTARKEVINEDDMLKLFSERSDLKYASDIAPDNKNEMLEKFGNRVFFTAKKLGAQTSEANINAGLAAAQQIIDYFEKGDTTFQVNK